MKLFKYEAIECYNCDNLTNIFKSNHGLCIGCVKDPNVKKEDYMHIVTCSIPGCVRKLEVSKKANLSGVLCELCLWKQRAKSHSNEIKERIEKDKNKDIDLYDNEINLFTKKTSTLDKILKFLKKD